MKQQNRENYFSHQRKEIRQFLPVQQNIILEIGCGAGNFAQHLFSNEKWGVEPDEKSANIALEHFDKVFNDSYENIESSIPDNYFDLIICNDVIEHVENHDAFLISLNTKLTKDGALVGSVPNVRYYDNLYDLLIKKDWKYVDSGILDRTHLRFFTEKSLSRTLQTAGFQLEMVGGVNSALRKKFPKRIGRHIKFALLDLLTFGNARDMKWLQIAFRAVKVR